MANLLFARRLHLALLVAGSPLGCVGNQTFDDGVDELLKRDAQAATNASDDTSDGAQSTEDLDDAAAPEQDPTLPVVDAGAEPSPETGDEASAGLDAAAPSASGDTPDAATGETTTDLTVTDATGSDASSPDVTDLVDAATVGGRDLEGELLSLTFADGLFVAVGTNGETPETGPQASWIITSEDGRNWTERHFDAQGRLWSVANSAGRWVAVGWDIWEDNAEWLHSYSVFLSDDGATWQSVSVDGLLQPQQVISAGEGFLLRDGSAIWFSEDGEEWTPKTSPGPVTWLTLTPENWPNSSGSRLFAGRSDGQVSVSDDLGETWSDEALGDSEISVDRLWVNAIALLGSGHSDSCIGEETSCRKDFMLTREATVPMWTAGEIGGRGSSVSYWPSTALIEEGVEVGVDGDGLAYRFSAVADWTMVDKGENTGARFSEIAFGAGTFVAAGAGGLRYSDDGETWQRYESIATE